ncbi:DUF4230 domain-containing protein [Limibacter armeniacum]|uniref:DUF4230 domain-containing protein n=1 Tax=Limibacter armeniacum TaxID=466084 RepID=UPI002FE533B6
MNQFKKLFPWLLVAVLALLVGRQYYQEYELQQRYSAQSVTDAVVSKVEALGKLELVKFNIADVITFKDENPWYMPDQEVFMVARGEAVGCVDLTKLTGDKVTMNLTEDTMYVNLPAPEVCYYKLDMKKTKVYDKSIGAFMNQTKLVNEAYKEGENRILHAALDEGLLEETRGNAQKMLKPLLENITGKSVILTFEPQAQPWEQQKR